MQAVVEHEADGADHRVRLVAQRHAGDHEGLVAELHDVENDRLAAAHHLAHQAVGDDLLDLAPQRVGRAGEAEALGVFVVDPADAGVAVDGWVTPDQLRQLVRRSYDPATALPDPTEDERPVMVGPMGMRESWSHLQTDTAFHVTYWVAQWPRTDVPASFLQPLILSPGSHRSFSLLLEPSSHETAMRRVRRAKVELAADAAQRARLGRLDDASSRAESDEVARREQQLVAGHGDVAFVGLVTVTAPTLDGLTAARRATEADAARAGCELRLLVGQQALAHAAATLPLARRLT